MKNFLKQSFALLLAAAVISVAGCKKNNGGGEDNPTVTKDEIVKQLGDIVDELQGVLDGATYGEAEGQYPESSKTILQTAINTITGVKDKVSCGTTAPAQSLVTTARSTADKAKTDFAATKNGPAPEPEPGELFVDGLTEDVTARGYIDFGKEEAYSKFGDPGKQAFTVELWVKLKQRVNGIGSVISVFNESGDDQTRKGWFINYFDMARLRGGYGFENFGLQEPSVEFGEDKINKWYHVAFTLDENEKEAAKIRMYLDGEEVAVAAGSDFNSKYEANNLETRMTAFGQCGGTGGMTEDWRLAGWIKHFHIWKGAKTKTQINDLMDGTTEVTGEETDLVCGWAFDKIPADGVTEITDITGKYTATLHGKYSWTKTN